MRIIIPFTLLILASAPALADDWYFSYWDRLYADARTESVAGADLAIARGPAAHYHCAAPLPAGKALQVGYSRHGLGWVNMYHVSLATEWRDFRFGVTQTEMGYTNSDWARQYFYELVGHTGSAEVEFRSLVLGASYDLARLFSPDGDRLRWIVGANYRGYDARFGRYDLDAGNLDFGTTLSWRCESENLHFGASGAVNGHNILGENLVGDGIDFELPHFFSTGLAVFGGLASESSRLLRADASLGYARIVNFGVGWHDSMNADSLGLEVLLGDILSIRWGYRARDGYRGRDEVSFGLQTPRWFISNGGVSVNRGGLQTWLYNDASWTFSAWVDF